MFIHRFRFTIHFITCLLLLPDASPAAITVIDDLGREITLEQPANRIISLAPHTTELIFAAGAGGKIVGAVRYSDYPEAAARITRVGDAHSLDMERILSLQPDLIVGWYSGNGASVMDRFMELGDTLYISEPKRLTTIAQSIYKLGHLAGTDAIAKRNSTRFLNRLEKLKADNEDRETVKVFYQIWHEPIFTIGGNHIISEIIQICGGRNIFSALQALSPQISLEAVLNANPDVIIASGAGSNRPAWLDMWNRWGSLKAVKNQQIYFIQPDLIQRHSPRILEGAAMMCDFIDRAR